MNHPVTAHNQESVRVLLPLALPLTLDYLPDGMDLSPGQFVRVPLSARSRIGVVWGAGSPDVPREKLKSVEAIIDVPPLSAQHMQFVDWVAAYTLSLPGAVLRMSMNVPDAFLPPPMRTLYVRGGPDPENMTSERAALLERLVDQHPRSVRELALLGQVGEGVVRGLVKTGTLIPVECNRDEPYPAPDGGGRGPTLSAQQHDASKALIDALKEKRFAPFLLEGVTGAGKTEVYFEAIAEMLKDPDAQALVLVPEIALTSQWLDRFEARFGAAPVEWHSDLGKAERRRAWRAVADGSARVVVAARSGLFLPFAHLGLVVVDEEHDPSFKQEEGVIYNARDMAVVRAKMASAPVVLASATPSYETYVNATTGKYGHLTLLERHGGAALPQIDAVDMRDEQLDAGTFISAPLAHAIEETISRGEQVLLFLNRRGYAPLTLCRHCGERIECPNCSAWLVEHRYRNELECHHCGHHIPKPKACPECGEEGTLVPCGPGVERLEEEVANRFPSARRMVMTSDTVTGPMVAAGFVRQIQSGAVDIIVGTQIVTKGYHFPKLTLVGVVDADLGLKGADLRAGERTYQQLAQVAGRAGREDRPGHVILQTYMPDHGVTKALVGGDLDKFRSLELDLREKSGMPPFGRMAAIIATGEDERAVMNAARQLAASAPRYTGVFVYGPAPAPLSRLKGRFRYRLLLATKDDVALQKIVKEWLAAQKRHKDVILRVDIDPQNFN